jgi:hypothetical protein
MNEEAIIFVASDESLTIEKRKEILSKFGKMEDVIKILINNKEKCKDILMNLITKNDIIKLLSSDDNTDVKNHEYIKLIDTLWGFEFSEEEFKNIKINKKKCAMNNWINVPKTIPDYFGMCVNFPIEKYFETMIISGGIFLMYSNTNSIDEKLDISPHTKDLMEKNFNNPKIIDYIKTIENNQNLQSKVLVLLWQKYSGIDISKNTLNFFVTFESGDIPIGVKNKMQYLIYGNKNSNLIEFYGYDNDINNLSKKVITHYYENEMDVNEGPKVSSLCKIRLLNIKEFENYIGCVKEFRIEKYAKVFQEIYKLVLEKEPEDISNYFLSTNLDELEGPITLKENIHVYHFLFEKSYCKNMDEYLLKKDHKWIKKMVQITSLMNEKLTINNIMKDTIKESYYIKVDNDNNKEDIMYVPINMKSVIASTVQELEVLKNEINDKNRQIEQLKKNNNMEWMSVDMMKKLRDSSASQKELLMLLLTSK